MVKMVNVCYVYFTTIEKEEGKNRARSASLRTQHHRWGAKSNLSLTEALIRSLQTRAQVRLEHIPAGLFAYGLRVLSYGNGRTEELRKKPYGLKYLLSGVAPKNFATPVLGPITKLQEMQEHVQQCQGHAISKSQTAGNYRRKHQCLQYVICNNENNKKGGVL